MKPILYLAFLASGLAVVAPLLMLLPTGLSYDVFSPDYPRVQLPVASHARRTCNGAVPLVLTLTDSGKWLLSGKGKVSPDEIDKSMREHVRRCGALGYSTNIHLRIDDEMPAVHLREMVLAAQREGVDGFTIATRSR